MKSRKVLLGLFVGLLACGTSFATAQTKANYQNNLVEIGPDNIGGRVRSIVADHSDPTGQTLFAGAVAGGLYMRDAEHPTWNYVPYYENGVEVTLPISCMVQHPGERTLIIATGESYYQKGFNFEPFAPKGRGMFLFDPNTSTFTQIANANFESVNRLVASAIDGTMYLFIGTNEGLYRMAITTNADWNSQPELVFEGAIDDVEILEGFGTLLFTSRGSMYRIGDVTAANLQPRDISTSNAAFNGINPRIEMAVSKNNPTYVYALVFDTNYVMQALYLSTNGQQSWTQLTTSTIVPFTSEALGNTTGTITVDPANEKRVFIGGSNVWVGQGYVEGSYYQWNKTSYSEGELNGGNYMSSVYSNSVFVHSGVHQILPVSKDGEYVYYIATDGGIYSTSANFSMFVNENRGLNNVQYNDIDVCPDGSIIGGAYDNSCPFIESRMAHNGGDTNNTWYDNTTAMNHNANIIWHGNGGRVAASMFQQVSPYKRRGIFVSSEHGSYGRAFSDYEDYTNTQTWTYGSDFVTNAVADGFELGQAYLWETDNNTQINDSVHYTLTENNYVVRNGEKIMLSYGDTILAGDTLYIPSASHFNYPIVYTFPNEVIFEEGMTLHVVNPYINRMFVVNMTAGKNCGVLMNWYPMNFSKVWSVAEGANTPAIMNWPVIFRETGSRKVINYLASSNDGNALFVSVTDTVSRTSTLMRIRGLNEVNYATDTMSIIAQLNFGNIDGRVCTYDTISYNGAVVFTRPITSIAVDRRNGSDDIIVTFGEFNSDAPSVLYIENASSDNYTIRNISPAAIEGPVYSALFEYTEGGIFVGSEEGVYFAENATSPTWATHGSFNGVPVTAIKQQIRELPIVRYEVHAGINVDNYLFARTKYPYAIYFGTYGRGVFMDTTYVTDMLNEIVDSTDYLEIPVVENQGLNTVSVYPNPAFGQANLDIVVNQGGNAMIKVYDLSGKVVLTQNMGHLQEGAVSQRLDLSNLNSGMYLVNVIVGKQSAVTKMIVR